MCYRRVGRRKMAVRFQPLPQEYILAVAVAALLLFVRPAAADVQTSLAFEGLPPTEYVDAQGQHHYPQCGDVIAGTLALTNNSTEAYLYSHVTVDLLTAGASMAEQPYDQRFPKPFSTIGPGETVRFPFELHSTKNARGNLSLVGIVQYPVYSLEDHAYVADELRTKAFQGYFFECGATASKTDSLFQPWSKLSGKAKAIWLAIAAAFLWWVARASRLRSIQDAVSRLMTSGKELSNAGLTGGNDVKPQIRQQPDGTICFQVPLDVCTDGTGAAVLGESSHQGYTTTGYINADTTNYLVLPGKWYSQFGIDAGDVGVIIYNGKVTGAVFAEVGPTFKLGEASVAALRDVGGLTYTADGRAKNAATPHAATVLVFPGSRNQLPRGVPAYVPDETPLERTNFPTNAEINSVAFPRARAMGIYAK
jgi:hypothetical protein